MTQTADTPPDHPTDYVGRHRAHDPNPADAAATNGARAGGGCASDAGATDNQPLRGIAFCRPYPARRWSW